jgi:hypothetical protein
MAVFSPKYLPPKLSLAWGGTEIVAPQTGSGEVEGILHM